MLRLLGSTWGAVGRVRAALYAGGWLPRRNLPRPVISVGALSVGGAGKTPATALLAALLCEAGFRPAILSRGYRRSGRAPTLVSGGDGAGPRVDVTHAGDEPYWLARVLPEVAVAVASRREQAAELALASAPVDVFLLDDGFQHLRVARDADLLVVNPEAPFWEDAPLPSGRLRERAAAARRAHAFLLVGRNGETRAALERRFGARPAFLLRRQPPGCWSVSAPPPPATAASPDGAAAPPPDAPAFAFAGIARPQRFFADLEDGGVTLRGRRAFPDHHVFRPADLQEVAAAAHDAGAEILLTTEKDAVRLPDVVSPELPIYVWSYRLAADDPRALLDWLERQAGLRAGRSAA